MLQAQRAGRGLGPPGALDQGLVAQCGLLAEFGPSLAMAPAQFGQHAGVIRLGVERRNVLELLTAGMLERLLAMARPKMARWKME